MEDAYTDDELDLVTTTLTKMESLDPIGADLQTLPRGTFLALTASQHAL